MDFVHSIPSLKTLQVSSLYDDIWKELHGRLFRENSLPHLEDLTLGSLEGCLDFKTLMSLSKNISRLELEAENDEFRCDNLEQTDLRGLKMLSFDHQIFDMMQITHIMTELEDRPEFFVQYSWDLNIEVAEKLGKWLTLPNFEWNMIEVCSGEEYGRAVQLCTNNCIDLDRITYSYRN